MLQAQVRKSSFIFSSKECNPRRYHTQETTNLTNKNIFVYTICTRDNYYQNMPFF